MDQKRATPRHIIIKMAKLKDKERIIKATRESSWFPTRDLHLDCHLISQQKYFRPEGSVMEYAR